jgi:hypothetical protein
MANEIDVTPVTVDYTDKDYSSLREALMRRVKFRINEWTGTDPNDFGVALIEAFAYMGDVLSYYIDRAANEMSLQTASQRSSILNLARMYGYTPSGYQSASCDVTFSNSSAAAITLPVGTQLSGQYVNGDTTVNVIFETAIEAVVPAAASGVAGSIAGITAYHGENVSLLYPEEDGLAGELLGSSDSSPNQSFRLLENQVVDGSVRVFVQRNNVYEEWAFLDRITDAGATDNVFTTYLDADNFVYVVFGDGVSGRIPTTHSQIKAQYVKGGGSLGRIPAQVGTGGSARSTLTTLYRIPGVNDISSIASKITFTHTAATGGLDPENSDIIRQVAPFALTAFDRAVSLGDYANLCLNSTAVGKANATAQSFTSVTVYISPAAENSSQDPYPGYLPSTYFTEYTAGTPEDALKTVPWADLRSAAESELIDKTQIGVSYTISPATYSPLKLTIKYTKAAQYTDAQVQASIRGVLETQYGYNQMSFAQTLYAEDIENSIKSLPGVENVTVAEMYRRQTGAAGGRATLYGAANEIFVVLPGETDFTVIEDVATDNPFTALAISAATLGWVKTTNSYSVTTASSTTTVTATAAGSPLRTYAVGVPPTVTPLASGVASSSINLATGLNTILVTALGTDLTPYTYTINITRT